MQTINPFELLGVNEKSSIKEARKNYYNLSLLCHPDHGGDEESMKILANAYKFVEEQIKNKNDVSEDIGIDLEEKFKLFNLKIKSEIPILRDLFDLVTEEQKKQKRNYKKYNQQFNQEFQDEQKYQFEELISGDPFSKGYGHIMDDNEDDGNKTDDEWVVPTKKKFTQEIEIYKEPHIMPYGYGNNFRYDVNFVKDFTEKQGELQMNDYVIAHSELENIPNTIKSNMDKPIPNLYEKVNKIEELRNQFETNYNRIDLVLSSSITNEKHFEEDLIEEDLKDFEEDLKEDFEEYNEDVIIMDA